MVTTVLAPRVEVPSHEGICVFGAFLTGADASVGVVVVKTLSSWTLTGQCVHRDYIYTTLQKFISLP